MELPVLFVSDGVVYPHAQIKLPIRSKSNFFMIESCLLGKSAFTMVAIVYGTDHPDSEQKFFNICTVAAVEKVVCWSSNNTATQYTLHVRGISRGEIVKHGVPLLELNQIFDPDTPLPEPALIADFLAHLMVLLSFAPANSTRDNLRRVLANKDRDINKIVYLTMALLRMVSYNDQLLFLAENDGLKRMEIALKYAKEAIKAYGSIAPKTSEVPVEENGALVPLGSMQSKRAPAKKRLNELEQMEQELQSCQLPEGTVRDTVMDDFQRLKSLPTGSHDYQVLYGYLKLVSVLPWNKHTEDSCDLEKSRKILDADHEGMADVKKRVLEFLAVKQMKKDVKGPILCLVGPPGVGKTSIAKAIADTLNRRFERIALGGVHDQSAIRGHRRTYVGAMPGRILQAVKQAKTRNPVILLDEVDKMSAGPQGDPAAALLEVLDPAQNHTFQDQYLNLPFDISQVLFVATANDASTIPGPLLDRMELIEMSGYTLSQKVEIAKKFIIPRQLAYHALSPDYLEFSPESLQKIVSRYTREAGVRQLERTVAAVCRWAALKVAQVVNGGAVELDVASNKLNLPIKVKTDNLNEILGVSLYCSRYASTFACFS
ncbi:unnamed protein product [Bursaphelenchus okinawaensis]|uniref:Lon N-terminal domain-containing protein n=1 Tax=Bursaphelenchus okinawaensis TaxID=465554 RepID=A0A811KNG7_9BILA|nr:unnamed protein product [Bursaphelenchus okinawaensis]CAG9107527.1 unnamed protein product [Bursaphelenchus okinawaensis]